MNLIDVMRARRRIAPYVRRTPLRSSAWLSSHSAADVSLKLESLQVSDSFKARGAFNAVIALLERPGGAPSQLVTASAGNHGGALAAAAEAFRVPLVVFTPSDAPKTKLDAIRQHGAVLRADGCDYDEAERMAKAYAAETAAEFISAYNDWRVVAGAATIALEIFEDSPDTDTLLIPIGGGGLIGGVAEAAKSIAPACQIVGVEAAASCAFQTSVRAGRIVEIVPRMTIADGLGGNPDPDTITFGLVRQFVDRIDTVTEDDLSAAIARLVETEHLVAEGAGAAAVAALVGRRTEVRGRRVAILVTGGNIDRERLAAILHRRLT